MEQKSDEDEVLQNERARVTRAIDVLFDRFSSTRQDAHRDLEKAIRQADKKGLLQALKMRDEAIRSFRGKELSDIRFLLDQLMALIDSNEDPSTWPAKSDKI